MLSEIFGTKDTLATQSETLLRKTTEVLEEMLSPCSRFKAPIDHRLLWDTRIARFLNKRNPFAGEQLMNVSDQPLNWLLLLDYLYKENIASEKIFRINTRPKNDLPQQNTLVRVSGVKQSKDTDGYTVERYGIGHSNSLENSFSSAIGELLERHCMSTYRNLDLRECTFNDMGKNVLDPASLNGFLPWQKKHTPGLGYRTDAKLRWVRCTNLLSGKPKWIPAQLIFWNYKHNAKCSESVLAETNTNGCGGGFTFEEATISGLLELIERDAFLIHWLNKLSPKKIDITRTNAPDKECRELLTIFEQHNIEYHFLDVTTDVGVPTVVCVVVNNSGKLPSVAIGSKSGFDLSKIITGSASEAILALTKIAEEHDQPIPELTSSYEPFIDPTFTAKHARFLLWQGKEMLERFSFFIENKQEISQTEFMSQVSELTTASAPDILQCLIERFRELGEGYDVYIYESEHRVLSALGYKVVRIIVPKLLGLYIMETFATLDSSRLRDVPQKIGYQSATQYNPWPHPFP